jgi:NAD(P)-dependent dehydrogenase (short-subunit alcohol dehydrogenase family)
MSAPQVALIMGAGSEFGQSLSRELSQAGMHVALNDLLPGRVNQLAEEINAQGGHALAFAVDGARKLTLQTMLQAVLEAWERIDVLVFIAAVQPTDVVLDMDEWDWHRTQDLNLTTAFLSMQSVGRIMRELGGGTVVNVLAGESSLHSAAYQTAAAGLQALSDAAATELAAHNIRVHTVTREDSSPQEIAKLCIVQPQVN